MFRGFFWRVSEETDEEHADIFGAFLKKRASVSRIFGAFMKKRTSI